MIIMNQCIIQYMQLLVFGMGRCLEEHSCVLCGDPKTYALRSSSIHERVRSIQTLVYVVVLRDEVEKKKT